MNPAVQAVCWVSGAMVVIPPLPWLIGRLLRLPRRRTARRALAAMTPAAVEPPDLNQHVGYALLAADMVRHNPEARS